MQVELLTVTDCPHRRTAVDRVREALDRVGATAVVVAERVVDDPAVAIALGMQGSPTVLVDGLDPFAADKLEGSVSCRLYRTQAGVEGAPSVDALVTAFSQVERGDR